MHYQEFLREHFKLEDKFLEEDRRLTLKFLKDNNLLWNLLVQEDGRGIHRALIVGVKVYDNIYKGVAVRGFSVTKNGRIGKEKDVIIHADFRVEPLSAELRKKIVSTASSE